MGELKIIETFRDGIQAIDKLIPTEKKVEFLNRLLKVGFHTVEVGSFVSPRAIPQLADTEEVLKQIDLSDTRSEVMVLVANDKGALKACQIEEVDYVSFPHSNSETFLQKNIRSSVAESFATVERLQQMCNDYDKKLVVYLAMGLGNPYGEEWSLDCLRECITRLAEIGTPVIPVSDTVGLAHPDTIYEVFSSLIGEFREIEFALHLHARPSDWYDKVNAAYVAGCRRFDAVYSGMGGCPMTGHEIIGNLDTNNLLYYFDKNGIAYDLDMYQYQYLSGMVDKLTE